ncbi:MAG: hypothetical protein OEQ18_16330, partial [Gammaproteobacteria bacterium]|nr:hypothetical protein [Gammaproteobacteria bacterium]
MSPGLLIRSRFDRRQTAGGLLAVLMALAVLHGAVPEIPAWPAGVAAWLAAVLLGRDISSGQRLQVSVLIALGVAALAWSHRRGVRLDLVGAIDQNHALLAMLAAVSFLRLVSVPVEDAPESAP